VLQLSIAITNSVSAGKDGQQDVVISFLALLSVAQKQESAPTCERMYPLEAKSDTRIEQAASTEVMPAAVPSIVFSNISEKTKAHE